jgi:hypothetical protein
MRSLTFWGSLLFFPSAVFANPIVIKHCAQYDAVFTVILQLKGEKSFFVIDRIIKGKVDAKIMAHLQLYSKLKKQDDSMLCMFWKNADKSYEMTQINRGIFSTNVNGKTLTCNLQDLIEELDEAPEALERKARPKTILFRTVTDHLKVHH